MIKYLNRPNIECNYLENTLRLLGEYLRHVYDGKC